MFFYTNRKKLGFKILILVIKNSMKNKKKPFSYLFLNMNSKYYFILIYLCFIIVLLSNNNINLFGLILLEETNLKIF